MSEQEATLLLLTSDPMVVRGASAAAVAAGMAVLTATDPGRRGYPPAVIVVDLEQPGAIDEVGALRSANREATIVGHLSRPEQDRWVEAERAGCDLVANRGSVGRQLKKLLAAGNVRRRYPLAEEADIAGRLGLVSRVEGTPVGTVGVYHVNGRVTAVNDVCPHSGGRLSAGVMENCVVTCPLHGSQFDVQTGERLRGPADEAVAVYEVVRDRGRVQLIWKD